MSKRYAWKKPSIISYGDLSPLISETASSSSSSAASLAAVGVGAAAGTFAASCACGPKSYLGRPELEEDV